MGEKRYRILTVTYHHDIPLYRIFIFLSNAAFTPLHSFVLPRVLGWVRNQSRIWLRLRSSLRLLISDSWVRLLFSRVYVHIIFCGPLWGLDESQHEDWRSCFDCSTLSYELVQVFGSAFGIDISPRGFTSDRENPPPSSGTPDFAHGYLYREGLLASLRLVHHNFCKLLSVQI